MPFPPFGTFWSCADYQMQILDAFRSRQSDEQQRYNGLLGLQRGHSLLTRKKWRQLKQFLTGPRGAWAHR